MLPVRWYLVQLNKTGTNAREILDTALKVSSVSFQSNNLKALNEEDEKVAAEGRKGVPPLWTGPPNSLGELGFHYPPFLCDEEKKDGRERKKVKEQNRGGEEEKKEAFDRAVWRPCVNEPVKGSHCLAATSIWYCTFLFLLHCLLSQCLLSPPLYSLSLA